MDFEEDVIEKQDSMDSFAEFMLDDFVVIENKSIYRYLPINTCKKTHLASEPAGPLGGP